MRAIEEQELRQYLEVARVPGTRPENYNEEDLVAMFKKVIIDTGFMESLMVGAKAAYEYGGNMESIAGSLWITGFMMGRELEHRNAERLTMETLFKEYEERV